MNIVWFKRDLRIEDHRPLARAVQSGRSVLPLYVIEPDLWRQPDTSERQWLFTRECLLELRNALRRRGADLIVRTGDVVDVVRELHRTYGVTQLWSHEETGNGWTYARDKKVAAWAREAGIEWIELPQFGVIRGLQSRAGWAGQWDRFMAEPTTPAPDQIQQVDGIDPGDIPERPIGSMMSDHCPQRQSGGRTQALSILDSFLVERALGYRKGMSSPLTGEEKCSRLSPFLALGAVSMREVYQASLERLKDLRDQPEPQAKTLRGDLNAFIGRLHWHCHFMQKLESAPQHEFSNVHSGYDGLREDHFDDRHYEAWASGQTGFPFIDACMRYLSATGWINFRMRAMLTAFSSYHLWLHWREPGLHLARQFVDYEAGIHWNQIQMQSGTTGINTVRIYNPVKQSYDQDPDGVFIRQWVPELANVPTAYAHEPWRMSPLDQDDAGCFLGKDYPERIVDHIDAAKAAREAIYAVRRSDAFREEANAIQTRHGSRKSGLPPSARKRAKRRPSNQDALPF